METNTKDTFRERMKTKTLDVMAKATRYTYYGLALGTASLVCLGVPIIGVNLGVEAIANPKIEHIEARLEKKDCYLMMQTKGQLWYGQFTTRDGRRLKVYDRISVLDGKLLQNSVIPNMNEGKNYSLEMRTGSFLGDYFVKAEEK